MASSSRNGEHRPVHQDFIARIRFSNALPPPPNPPKLLEIPNTGLSSGQYTTPGFASRLAREQPLNIEADAELGMPLDLVGMPGIFDGDESSIQAPAQPPPVHPHDRALLRPLQTLGKPKVSEPTVSFLRRTEYISSIVSKGRHDSPLRSVNSTPLKRPQKRPSPEPDKDSPAYIKRKIDQSFATAASNLKDRSRVKHPSKRNLKLVDAYPLVPDLDAFPDSGAYVTIKFTNNPIPPSRTYDRRLLSTLFRPADRSQAEEEAYQFATQAYERDPQNNPKPPVSMNYDMFLADTTNTSEKFRQRFDVENHDNGDDGLYTNRNGSRPSFSFPRLRAYETAHELELDHETKYDDELLLSFNDDDTIDQKAVFYYPVMQRSTIRPQRTRNIARTIVGAAEDDGKIIDQLEVTVEEPNDDVKKHTDSYKNHPYGVPEEDDDPEANPSEAEETSQQNDNGDAQPETNGTPKRQVSESDEDQDAEGDDEE